MPAWYAWEELFQYGEMAESRFETPSRVTGKHGFARFLVGCALPRGPGDLDCPLRRP